MNDIVNFLLPLKFLKQYNIFPKPDKLLLRQSGVKVGMMFSHERGYLL